MNSGKVISPILKYVASKSCGLHPYPVALLSLSRFASTEALEEERKDVTAQERFQLTRPSVTKWKRPPFVKNFFVGKIDINLLDFPEILDYEHLLQIEGCVKRLNNLYTEKVNSCKIEEERRIPEDVLQDLKDMGLFGKMVPTSYGGLGLTYTEYSRLNEVIGFDLSIGLVLAVHELLAVQTLVLAGNEAQKEKFLPDLASGKKVAAFCCYEADSGYDTASIKSMLSEFGDDQKMYVLNGVKPWVTNGAGADLLIVVCKTNAPEVMDQPEVCFAIIDPNTEGITISPCNDKICLHGSKAAAIQFDDVVVPKDNVIMLGSGLSFPLLNKLLESYRFGVSTLPLGILKSLFDYVTEYTIHAERAGQALADAQLIRFRLSKIAQRLYAMESVSYLTAAIYDSSENPDCYLESTIAKIYNTEGMMFCLRELMQILGTLSLSKSHQFEKFYRDAQGLASVEVPNDMLRLLVGLTGCQYAGSGVAETVWKLRNPSYFPYFKLGEMYKSLAVHREKFSYNQDVAGNLHPSLVVEGNALEECIQRVQSATKNVLTVHGAAVVETQFDPVRLGNMAIDAYVMSAVLCRNSRSYCIGLRNSTHELKLVRAISVAAVERIKKNLKDIAAGPALNEDLCELTIGEQLIDCRGYFPQHPLKHNYGVP